MQLIQLVMVVRSNTCTTHLHMSPYWVRNPYTQGGLILT